MSLLKRGSAPKVVATALLIVVIVMLARKPDLVTGGGQPGSGSSSRSLLGDSPQFLSENNVTRDCVTWAALTKPKSETRPVNLESAPQKTASESDLHRKESFAKIWDGNSWGKEAKSGPGSLLENTLKMRKVLGLMIERIKKALNKDSVSLLDSSCGDMTWMPTFLANRSDVIFTGYDIVPANVEGHSQKFSGKPWNFEVHDIVSESVPNYDIILSRHTLQHLKTGDVESVLANFLSSGSSFLLTTNFPLTKKNSELNEDQQYRFRPVNLLLAPYYLPPPVCSSLDIPKEHIDISLWDLRRIREGLQL